MSALTIISAAWGDFLRRDTRYITACGLQFTVDHRGWLLDEDMKPVPHPLVDDVMLAILAWERK
jgi:hypothetical protein